MKKPCERKQINKKKLATSGLLRALHPLDKSKDLLTHLNFLMTQHPTQLTCLLAGLLGFAFAAQGSTILVDFGDARTTPTDANWNNEISVAGSGTYDLIDVSGNTTGINISFSGAIDDSSNTNDHSATRTEFPAWSDSNFDSLQDRVWQTSGTTGTMTISGLSSGATYDLELFSSYQTGTAGRDTVDYVMSDGDGPVEGFHMITTGVDRSLGSTVTWYAQPAGAGVDEADYGGWLGWFGMTPDSSGDISLSIATNGGGDSRGSLNAMRIEVDDIPETSAYAAILGIFTLGCVAFRRRRR